MRKIIFSKRNERTHRSKIWLAVGGIALTLGVAFGLVQYRYGDFIDPNTNVPLEASWAKAFGRDVFYFSPTPQVSFDPPFTRKLKEDAEYSRWLLSLPNKLNRAGIQTYVIEYIKRKYYIIILSEKYIQAQELDSKLKKLGKVSAADYSRLAEKVKLLYKDFLEYKYKAREWFDPREYPEQILRMDDPRLIDIYEKHRGDWNKVYGIEVSE